MDVAPTTAELIALFERGELASQMGRRFGLSGMVDTQIIEERCIMLHNAGTIDLFGLVEEKALQRLTDTVFFMASYFLCRLLPKLDSPPERMMRCVDELVTRGGADGAANQPNAAFDEWCVRFPLRAKEVVAAAHEGDELACQHLSFALRASNDLIEARCIALEYNDVRRQSAIAALGRIGHPSWESCTETFAVFNVLLDRGVEDSVRAGILSAMMQMLEGDFVFSPTLVDSLISRLVTNSDEFTIHQCARELWRSPSVLTPNIVGYLLDALSHLSSANKGTVNELDLGLRALLENGFDNDAISFVTMLFSRPENDLSLQELDSFTNSLLSGSSDRLSQVVVQWLELGVPHLCDGLAEAIKGEGLDGVPLNLMAKHLNLPAATQVFICRKAVGWFFLKPTTAASVIVSMLRICEEDVAQELQQLLVDPLLKNYGGLRDYLNSLTPLDAASKAVFWALAQNDLDLEAQQSVPLIPELKPSEHHRRIEHLRISDQFRDAHRLAESGSTFLNLVSRSMILYGNRSISFVADGRDNLRPVEVDLHSHSISYEMPRMEVFDPVGLSYILRVFRMEKMK